MPKLITAREPQDAHEERRVRRLARSRLGPRDCVLRAKMVALSWDGQRVPDIAVALECHPKTVRARLAHFDANGIAGLRDQPRPGRARRSTAAERSRLIRLVATDPPGRLVRHGAAGLDAADEALPACWTRDTLTEAAVRAGIAVARSHRPEGTRAHFARRAGALAGAARLGDQCRSGVRPTRTAVVTAYTSPPGGATTICVDELGPVIPRTFPPASGWSPTGHRLPAPLEYSRGVEKVWVYGALRVRDGQALTLTTRSRNTAGYLGLLEAIAVANPTGDLYLVSDNLSSPKSPPIQDWLTKHPRVRHLCIPVGACWLNLQEAWWRIFRRAAFAGQTCADGEEIDRATKVATTQLNARAKPWVWGRPQRPPRLLRHAFVYRI
jgi:transposase